MSEIKAFVGHSFTPDDEAVVTNFLTFFTQLNGILANFAWTHAEEAEPKELTKKILKRIDDCNTLIAICTKKEMVLPPEAIRQSIFRTSRINNSLVEWKTSDWIIQEIGLAIGRNMSVIILLEEGCRRPGGLQGDIEYIPFDRSSPEKAHGKLLEMIKALQPPAALTTGGARTEIPKDEPPVSQDVANDDVPDASWSKLKFENGLFWAILRKRKSDSERINNAFLESVYVTNDEDRVEWLSKAERWRITYGNGGSVSTVREFCDQFPTNAQLKGNLAAVMSHLGEAEEAANLYLKAVDLSDDVQFQGQCLSAAARNFGRSGNVQEAFHALDRLRNSEFAQEEQTIAYSVKDVGNAMADTHLEIEAMEAIVRLTPDDYDQRFNLAYAHSKEGNEDMALHHYLAIPPSHRSAATWNNLGVAYQNFSLPGKSVGAYRKAADEGETLAMSNLAYKLMGAGFLDEASQELKKAMSLESPHRNVGEAYSSLSDIPENEQKRSEEFLKEVKRKVEFYRKLSRAILKNNVKNIIGTWNCPNGDLYIDLVDRRFFAKCEYQVEGNSLSGLLGTKVVSNYVLEMKGYVLGNRVFGTITRERTSGPTGFLGSTEQDRYFALVFADDLNSAEVVENITSRSPSFFHIEAINNDSEGSSHPA